MYACTIIIIMYPHARTGFPQAHIIQGPPSIHALGTILGFRGISDVIAAGGNCEASLHTWGHLWLAVFSVLNDILSLCFIYSPKG